MICRPVMWLKAVLRQMKVKLWKFKKLKIWDWAAGSDHHSKQGRICGCFFYCHKNVGWETTEKEEHKKRTKRTDSAHLSYDLYLEHRDVSDVARMRNLTEGTIEGHLLAFVESGDLAVEDLVSEESIIMIEEVLASIGSNERLSLIKSKLPANISYGDIKAVLLKGKKN